VTNDLYKKVIKSDPQVVPVNYNTPLAEYVLEELQLYNSMYTNSIYGMEGKEKSTRPPQPFYPSPAPSNHLSIPAPAPPPVPSFYNNREWAPLDFAATDVLKEKNRSATDITSKIVSLFQYNVQCCPLH